MAHGGGGLVVGVGHRAVAAGLEAPAVHRRDPEEAVMRVVALISWIVTALAGASLIGIWVARGGPRRQGAVAILLVVAALGFTMARLWRQERAAAEAATGRPATELPPEQHFPVP
jgi:hypothetical protein